MSEYFRQLYWHIQLHYGWSKNEEMCDYYK